MEFRPHTSQSKLCNQRRPHTTQLRTLACLSREFHKAWSDCVNRPDHPGRKNIEHMSSDAICTDLRDGTFDFWRDLVPPFQIASIVKDDARSTVDDHYYKVLYMCGLDYRSERAIFRGKESSTFDSRLCSVALIRLPPRYHGKGLRIINWGSPSLNGTPSVPTVSRRSNKGTYGVAGSTSACALFPEGTKLLKRAVSAPGTTKIAEQSMKGELKKRLPRITNERLPLKKQVLIPSVRYMFPFLSPS
eukprot:GEMP01037572.1.p1 GENE.GEMP01037572.1~~GEMP01037572.1.p1  ORF type:complete len:246 (+),score=19.54 GEMP01037572.1:155-892(+)